MVVTAKARTKSNLERFMRITEELEKIEGDAAATASPRIQQKGIIV
jgi:hypothetical protein